MPISVLAFIHCHNGYYKLSDLQRTTTNFVTYKEHNCIISQFFRSEVQVQQSCVDLAVCVLGQNQGFVRTAVLDKTPPLLSAFEVVG